MAEIKNQLEDQCAEACTCSGKHLLDPMSHHPLCPAQKVIDPDCDPRHIILEKIKSLPEGDDLIVMYDGETVDVFGLEPKMALVKGYGWHMDLTEYPDHELEDVMSRFSVYRQVNEKTMERFWNCGNEPYMVSDSELDPVRSAFGLMNSMIRCGEDHSESSEQVADAARKVLWP